MNGVHPTEIRTRLVPLSSRCPCRLACIESHRTFVAVVFLLSLAGTPALAQPQGLALNLPPVKRERPPPTPTLVPKQPLYAQAKQPPIDMHADRLEMDHAKGIIAAQGDVSLAQADLLSMQADEARYLFASGQIEALGHVQLERQGDRFTSDKIVFQTEQQEGTLHQVDLNLRGPGGRATAKTVVLQRKEKQPDHETIALTDAAFTNCECALGTDLATTPWHFTAKRVDMDRAENTLTARNIRLYAGDVPVFGFPWWQQPLMPKRKSGLLRPVFLIGGNGLETELPYYWNISKNRDATLALRSVTQRGVMGKLQYRYLGDNHVGQLDTHGIYDTLDEAYRGLLVFDHVQSLGDWTFKAHLERSRTRDYLNDFSQQLLDNRMRRLESVATADRVWTHAQGYSRFQSGVRWYQDLTQEDDDVTIQSLPFVLVTDSRIVSENRPDDLDDATPFGRWHLDSKLHMDNFYQLAGKTAQRVDLAPTLHVEYPIHIGRVSAALGVRETLYLMPEGVDQNGVEHDKAAHRESALFSVRLDTALRRAYRDAYQHTLEPSVQYVVNAVTDQAHLPNYDASLRSVTTTDIFAQNIYSGVDRISRGQWVAYGLTSRLLNHTQGALWEKAVLTLGQRWAPAGERTYQNGHAFSSLASSLDLSFADHLSLATTMEYDPYRRRIESADTVFSLAFGAKEAHTEIENDAHYARMVVGHHFNNPDTVRRPGGAGQPNLNLNLNLIDWIDAWHSEDREQVHDLSLHTSVRLFDRWTWKQTSDYSLAFSQFKSWRLGVTYVHPCWDITITGGRELATTTNEHGGGFVGFFINLQGLGGVGI